MNVASEETTTVANEEEEQIRSDMCEAAEAVQAIDEQMEPLKVQRATAVKKYNAAIDAELETAMTALLDTEIDWLVAEGSGDTAFRIAGTLKSYSSGKITVGYEYEIGILPDRRFGFPDVNNLIVGVNPYYDTIPREDCRWL